MPALSPSYGLALIVLHGGGGRWPGLLLHSPALAWPFDGPPRDDVAQLAAAAEQSGLYRVDDPFADDLPTARALWVFHLPGGDRKARLTCLDGDVELARTPAISDDWWAAAVEAGSNCRMLIAVGVDLNPTSPSFTTIAAAIAAGRVFGATIPVRFFPEQPQ